MANQLNDIHEHFVMLAADFPECDTGFEFDGAGCEGKICRMSCAKCITDTA